MSRWFRMYDDLLDDPKVQRLPPDLFKAWVNLLCLASRNDGVLPCLEDIAFALRIDEAVADQIIGNLADRGLMDETAESVMPHNWNGRQFKSDKDETAADRQRAKRERDKAKPVDPVTDPVANSVTRDMSVTSHPPEADTEQIQNRAEQKDEGRAAACVEIGKRITDFMGVTNDPRWLGNWSTVSVWLSQGFDAELDILPTVVSMVERFKRTGKTMPGSLKYFSRAIAENHKARLATGQSPVQATATTEFCTIRKGSPPHRAWMAHFRRLGRKMAFYEAQEVLTVPSEYPPSAENEAA